ncbi:MAG TPA: DNA damage-inducible protein D [Rhabdochlamydiaceae bacterium]
MRKDLIGKLTKNFEDSAQKNEGVEYWMARNLQELLEYKDWDNFLNVIQKAKTACNSSNMLINNHFRDATEMVSLGSGAQRSVPDIMLSRYACYLIAQNGDPRKETIAFAQTYFALQTRKQEILEKRIEEHERLQARNKLAQTERELSAVLYEHGVDSQGFARIRSKGDQSLFGGRSTGEMKQKLGVPESRPLADFLPTITIKAKDFAGEITHFNVKKEGLHGEEEITGEHVKNNQDVRQVLAKSHIYPEELPPEEDIKKLERRLNNRQEQSSLSSTELPQVSQSE